MNLQATPLIRVAGGVGFPVENPAKITDTNYRLDGSLAVVRKYVAYDR